jgi:hypothetical protein
MQIPQIIPPPLPPRGAEHSLPPEGKSGGKMWGGGLRLAQRQRYHKSIKKFLDSGFLPCIFLKGLSHGIDLLLLKTKADKFMPK